MCLKNHSTVGRSQRQIRPESLRDRKHYLQPGERPILQSNQYKADQDAKYPGTPAAHVRQQAIDRFLFPFPEIFSNLQQEGGGQYQRRDRRGCNDISLGRKLVMEAHRDANRERDRILDRYDD